MTKFCNTIADLRAPDPRGEFISNMTTKTIDPKLRAWIAEQAVEMPRRQAAALLYNHAFQDWRDIFARLDLSTLVIGGRASHVPWRSQQWISDQIPDSRLYIFDEDAGGSHYMFIENPTVFNDLVAEFVEG